MNGGFVFADEAIKGIRWEAKYATWDNFTGAPVDGYEVNRIVVTKELAKALKKGNDMAQRLGYGLFLWDGYRPQRAVDRFVTWAQQEEDGRKKEKYYPNINRAELLSQGYVASHSSHSRGSAIDLSLYDLQTKDLLPMGTEFDFMDSTSHHGCLSIGVVPCENRKRLRYIMEESGFVAYENEWWHYVLKQEPYPNTYFNFPMKERKFILGSPAMDNSSGN